MFDKSHAFDFKVAKAQSREACMLKSNGGLSSFEFSFQSDEEASEDRNADQSF